MPRPLLVFVAAALALSGCADAAEPGPGAETSPDSASASASASPTAGVLPVPDQSGWSPGASGAGSATGTPPATSPGGGPESPPDDADVDDPASLAVVVNKRRPLDPSDYEASDLRIVDVPYVYEPMMRDEAASAVERMFAAFRDETGLRMQSQSAYRSYASQQSVYAGWVSSLGRKAADLTSARPGYSEHQTGLAIDISAQPAACALDQCFADTPQGEWLAANAWKYGFILRYPDGQTDVTGYEFEPWHYRYIGVDLAAEYHRTGAVTLEGFFGLPPAPEYAG